MFNWDSNPQASGQLDHSRLISLINSISDGFLAVNSNGMIELSNGVALGILNTNSLEGKSINNAMPLSDPRGTKQDFFALVGRQSSFVSRDFGIHYPDGTMISLYLSISAVRAFFGGENKGGYVVLFRDITESKSIEEERDEFISVVSHELRTPIAIAEGSISNAAFLASKQQLSDSITQSINAAHQQIVFLGSLVNDLAMLSRADRGKLALSAEEFDISQLINELAKDYAQQIQKKGLSFVVEPSKGLTVTTSKLYVREILQNFITNSIKYTEKGSIVLKAVKTADGVNLSVADTGIGIGQNEQAKLFTKFFRSEDWRVKQSSGTGLGLYVSSKLARLIGGKITMSSKLNEGSTFNLHIPYTVHIDRKLPAPSSIA